MRDYVGFFEHALHVLSKCKVIYDVGGGSPFQKSLAKYRSWFDDSVVKSVDVDARFGPDIVGDIHNLPLENGCADGVLCLSVLEHVSDPKKAVQEMHRILKQGGVFVGWVPAVYPYHARKGFYPDNFRFFDDGLRVLFSDFSKLQLHKTGGYFETMLYFLPGQVYLVRFGGVAYFLDRLFRTHKRTVTRGFYILAIK
ncbi:class I SAM-dependent methyltransferase [Candidatus Woesearchaeota archaeon]|nr:class I SAM-dependent methyltransferase [Candidatus Woesearchaeota archaeon]